MCKGPVSVGEAGVIGLPTLEPDSGDREVIGQALTRTPAARLRNASTRRPRIPVLATPDWHSCSESSDILHAGDDERHDKDDHEGMLADAPDFLPFVQPLAILPSSLASISHCPCARVPAFAEESQYRRLTLDEGLNLDERIACSSKELAEQRARDRQRYMDTPSFQSSDGTPSPPQLLQPALSLQHEVESADSQFPHTRTLIPILPPVCSVCYDGISSNSRESTRLKARSIMSTFKYLS